MKTPVYLRSALHVSHALLFAFLLVAGGILSACTEEGQPEGGVETDTAGALEGATEEMTNQGVRLDVAEGAPYGQYLTDGEGRPVYLFTADAKGDSSACHDACADAWPPLTLEDDSVSAASAVDSTMIATIQRDGERQVTYGGWPLYYFAKDEGEGEPQGQDVQGFGGEWYLVSPKGEQIEAAGEGQ